MAVELTFAMITPYSLAKSRTGGIIGRLVSQTKLDLVGARMYSPSDKFVDELVAEFAGSKIKGPYKKAFCDYIDTHYRSAGAMERGFTNRFMLLLFKGKNAVREIRNVVGSPTDRPTGNTVRGTYGDCIVHGKNIEHFEPGVITAADNTGNKNILKLLSKYAEKDGGVLDTLITYPKGAKPETTLVMLKPDNFVKRSSRPGNIIDMFANTGLTIVGARLFSMSLKQGAEFYGFLEKIFVEKLKFLVEKNLKASLDGSFDFGLDDDDYSKMADILKHKNAHCEVSKIVEFMTGIHPDSAPANAAGTTKCLALLYQGENAIEKVRKQLGPTDPSKAEGGTVRSDYGRDLMKNGAHASDSVPSAQRERPIVGLSGTEKSDEKKLIDMFLKGKAI